MLIPTCGKEEYHSQGCAAAAAAGEQEVGGGEQHEGEADLEDGPGRPRPPHPRQRHAQHREVAWVERCQRCKVKEILLTGLRR